jgi:hypothetical protein
VQTIPKNAQETYDRLYEAAYDGTFPSVGKNAFGQWQCRYRATTEKDCPQRCGAGIFVPDDKYNPSMEGASALKIIVDFHAIKLPEGISDVALGKIQTAHDDTAIKYLGYGNDKQRWKKLRWSPRKFIERINALDCFENVDRKSPRKKTPTPTQEN